MNVDDAAPSPERLIEVALLLPTELARTVMTWPSDLQQAAVGMLAVCIDYWEEQGVKLDPVQFEVIATSIVTTSHSAFTAMSIMAERLAYLELLFSLAQS